MMNALRTLFLMMLPIMCLASQPSIQRFPRPKDPTTASQLGQTLADIDRGHAKEAFDCWRRAKQSTDRAAFRRGVGFWYDVRYRVLFEGPVLLSVEENLEIFCANPYPHSSTLAITIDLRTGQRYDPTRLYRIRQWEGSSARLLPEVEAALRKRMRAAPGLEALQGECGDVLDRESPIDESGSFGFTRRGLVYLPAPVHAVQGCYQWRIILPYAELRRFLDPDEAARIEWTR